MKVIKVWFEEEKKLGFICFIENTLKMLSNTEAVVQRCSVKNAFIEIGKIHRKTPVPDSLF